MKRMAWFAALALFPGGAPGADDALIAEGRGIYEAHCTRCHGADGDELGYAGIVPLSGITRRYEEHEIMELSAPFIGKVFEGREAQALTAYLGGLPGEKGFRAAGLIVSPHLLERKSGHAGRWRIFDLRSAGDFAAGHIPNAVHWPGEPGPCHRPNASLAADLASLGVGPGTVAVAYDAEGGPAAACLQRRLLELGHSRAALLDGGWLRWQAEGMRSSRSEARIEPQAQAYGGPFVDTAPPSLEPDRSFAIDWRELTDEEGLLPADELRDRLAGAGLKEDIVIRFEGPAEEAAFLQLVLELLGATGVAYSPAEGALFTGAGWM